MRPLSPLIEPGQHLRSEADLPDAERVLYPVFYTAREWESLIIDSRPRLVAPPELYAYRAALQSSGGFHSRLDPKVSGVAGLPQSPRLEPARRMAELERRVLEFGFVGALLNPRPRRGAPWKP